MRKIIAAGLASVVFAGVASAADPGFFFPGGARQDSIFHAPGTTLNGKTVLQWGLAIDANAASAASAQSSADAAQVTANAAIPLNQKGVAGGVAGLNGSGVVTAPSNGTLDNSSIGQPSSVTNTQPQIKTTRLFIANPLNGRTAAATSWSDGVLDPSSLTLGGLTEEGGYRLNLTAHDSGPNYLGTVFSVSNSDRPFGGIQPGIAPSTIGEIAGSNTMDSVVENNYTGTIPPVLSIGSQITSEDGVTHTVTFTSGTVSFSPAISSYMASLIRSGMYISTNIVGGTQGEDADSVANGRIKGYLYTSLISGWSANSDGTVSTINVSGWVVSGSGNSTPAAPPASGPFDTLFSSYTAPAIFIGAPTKTFNVLYNEYIIDPLVSEGAAGDGNNPKGNVNSLVRETEIAEMDMELYSKTDYKYSAHGMTIGLDSHYSSTNYPGEPVRPSMESWDFSAGGTIPIMYQSLEPYWSYILKGYFADIKGGESPGLAQGSQSLMAEFAKHTDPSTNTGTTYDANTARIQMLAYRNAAYTSGASGAINTVDLRVQYRGAGTNGNFDGYAGGYLALLQNGGVQLCGTSVCGVEVDASGNTTISQSGASLSISGNTTINNGKSLTILGTGSSGTSLYYSSGALQINSSVTTTGAVTAPQVNYGAATYSTLGDTAVQGTQRYCSDCYSTSNAAKTTGIPVWWNGSAWTDALGQDVGH